MSVALFRAEDQNSNAYARYPVKVIQKVTTFTRDNWIVPQMIAQSTTLTVGSKVSKIIITSNDTVDNGVLFFINYENSISTLPIAFDTVPAMSGSGIDLVKLPINSLRSTKLQSIVDVDNNGNTFFMLETGNSIWAAMRGEISAGKSIQILTSTDDY